MTIAVNCWILKNKNLDGIGYYIVNTFPQLIKSHPEVDFVIFCDKNFSGHYFNLPNVKLCRIFPPYRHPLLYIYFLEFVLPAELKKEQIDILICPDGFLSLRSKCPQVNILPDINFAHNPGNMDLKNRLYYNFFFKKFAHKAERIIAISEFTKKDIVETYHVEPSKIDVMLLAIAEDFYPVDDQKQKHVKAKYSSGCPYYFFVGTMHPRKNIKRLILGFEEFKKRTGSDFKLLLAGAILWKTSDIEEAYESSKFKSDIIFVGRVSDEELRALLGSAYALCFVSLFEGFGLPVLEAMHSETAVICSNVSSIPEVGGEAVLYVDPLSVDSIAGAMEKLQISDVLRDDLIEKSKMQRKKFTISNTVQSMWSSIEKVAKSKKLSFRDS